MDKIEDRYEDARPLGEEGLGHSNDDRNASVPNDSHGSPPQANMKSRSEDTNAESKWLSDVPGEDLLFAVTDSESRRTWLEATQATGGPSEASYEIFGFNPNAEGDDLLAVTDGVRKIDILDKTGSLSPRLLRYSMKHNGGRIPAAAGGVRSDAVLRRNPTMGMAWEPVGGTDDTDSLNQLIQSVSEHGGGTVVLPPGATLGSAILAPGVSLIGSGQRITKLVLPNGANRSVVQLNPSHRGLKNYRSEVQDLTIEGNRFNQTVWERGPGWARNSLENYGSMPHGIWMARSEAKPGQDDEGLDLYHLVNNVRLNDVYGAAVFGRSGNGGTVFQNVVALRPGIGFISPPDCSWSDCTVGQSEFAGVYSMHGSVNYSNVKVWMAGTAVLNAEAPSGVAYRRRWSNGWEFRGHGSNVTVSSCSSQNNSGHGIWLDSEARGTVIHMTLDANNTVVPWAMRSPDDLDPWLTAEENNRRQVYMDDGVTRAADPTRATTPSGHVGAFIEGSGNILNVFSTVASAQDVGTVYGWQRHAVSFGAGAQENMVTVAHYTRTASRQAGDILKEGPTGRNYVVGNGRVLDSMKN